MIAGVECDIAYLSSHQDGLATAPPACQEQAVFPCPRHRVRHSGPTARSQDPSEPGRAGPHRQHGYCHLPVWREHRADQHIGRVRRHEGRFPILLLHKWSVISQRHPGQRHLQRPRRQHPASATQENRSHSNSQQDRSPEGWQFDQQRRRGGER